MARRQRRCLHCGFAQAVPVLSLDDLPPRLICPKCDADIYGMGDGSALTVDIAHHHETVLRAMQKLEAAVLAGWEGHYDCVRLVVGGGLIRNEVLGQLLHYRRLRRVREFREDGHNRGAILVQLR